MDLSFIRGFHDWEFVPMLSWHCQTEPGFLRDLGLSSPIGYTAPRSRSASRRSSDFSTSNIAATTSR